MCLQSIYLEYGPTIDINEGNLSIRMDVTVNFYGDVRPGFTQRTPMPKSVSPSVRAFVS